MKAILLHLTIAVSLICGSALYAETPKEGAKAIHALLEAKSYHTLFTTRYSEWHKVAKEGVKAEDAVAKLAGMFEKKSELFLDLYKQLAAADFEMGRNEHAQESETGNTATAKVRLGGREIPFTLYEMKDGSWGFHL